MNDQNFSLCIPFYDFLDNRVSNLMWRVADFSQENNELYTAKYTIEGDVDYLPRKISVNPYVATPFKPSIYTWSRSEDARVRSNDTEIIPIEVVKLDESILENHNSDFNIRSLLHKGIQLYEHTLEQFMLVINEDDTYYEALILRRKMSSSNDKNIFKIEKTCQDMLRAKHKVDLITFEKNCIIDTKEINIYSAECSFAPIRYFYKFLSSPRITRMFELREPQDYAKAFINKYLKTKQDIVSITNKDRQKLGQMIDVTLTDKAEIASFFDETGYSLEDVEKSLLNLNSDMLNLLLDNSKFSDIIEDAILRNDELQTELLDVAEKKWVEKSTKVKLSLEKSIEETEINLEKAKNEYAYLSNNIKKSVADKIKFDDEIKEKQQVLKDLEDKIKEIKSNIQSELNSFQDDVVHLAAMSALSNTRSKSSNLNKGFITQICEKTDDLEPSPAKELDIFAEDLQINLEIGGVNSSKHIISQVITSTLLAKKNLILDANSANIADGLSMLLDSCCSNKVYVTDSVADVETLVEQINALTPKVVLIYGLLDTYNERLFVTLSHLCKNKFIIFACEDTDTFDSLPSHWWSYATILSLRGLSESSSSEEYISYTIDKGLFEYKKDSKCDIRDIEKVVSKYKKNNNMPQSQAVALRELFSICRKIFGDFKLIQEYLIEKIDTSLELIEV